MTTWEVFDPTDGEPIITVRHRWFARFLSQRFRLDYERPGAGWV